MVFTVVLYCGGFTVVPCYYGFLVMVILYYYDIGINDIDIDINIIIGYYSPHKC